VSLGFVEEEIYVDEDESAEICLQLRDVNIPTQTQIWANVVSEDGSAIGNIFKRPD
jgi:hypothetical protein